MRLAACTFSLFLLIGISCAVSNHAHVDSELPSEANLSITSINPSNFPKVELRFTVVDKAGNYVAGLAPDDVSLSDSDETITDFQMRSVVSGKEKLAVVLVVDRSGSMKGAPLTSAKAAAAEFISRMSEGNMVGLVTFSSRPGPLSDITTDRDAVRLALDSIKCGGETAFYDAVIKSVDQLRTVSADRKAVVALTDGYDNASSANADECIQAASSEGITLHTIGLGKQVKPSDLARLARETGGSDYIAAKPGELGDIYRSISRSIKSYYVITYTSSIPAENVSWRTVKLAIGSNGRSCEDSSQYPVPKPGPDTELQARDSISPTTLLIFGFIAVDGTLAACILRRRRHRR